MKTQKSCCKSVLKAGVVAMGSLCRVRMLAFLALAIVGGCATERQVKFDASHPLIRVTRNGIRFQDRFVRPDEVPGLLEKNRIPKKSTIHVLVDDDFNDQQALWTFQHNFLNRAGYTRTMIVHERQYRTGSRTELKPVSRKKVIPYEPRFQKKPRR